MINRPHHRRPARSRWCNQVSGGDDRTLHINNSSKSLNEKGISETLKYNETWEKEDLYLGYSGNPWISTSILFNKNEDQLTESLLNNDTSSFQTLLSTSKGDHKRFKRGVLHLYNMLLCATDCNPLSYKGYGCYCGFLGSGYIADGIDRCCMMHDRCYDATECPMLVQYLVPYYWKCFRGRKPICAVDHGKWGGSGSCAQRLCECDRSFAECLSRFPCPAKKAVCTSSPWRLVQNLFMIY
ncbi:otoconin-90 isoform X2 [Belonocnema kinseyi]|uniref:otoconin-90 isoform X2 n=1 Tax=Belonocnema kinseyi TaxID=2817044 RepID=UPI00143CE0A7|nr:otoconin-90 isoform X2 [Belonocnema kinseyi]